MVRRFFKLSETLILPYAFSTDTMGFNLGLAGMRRGFYQDQMAVGATAFGGEVSQGIMLGLWDYKVPGSQRLFFSAYGFVGLLP